MDFSIHLNRKMNQSVDLPNQEAGLWDLYVVRELNGCMEPSQAMFQVQTQHRESLMYAID